MDKNALTSPAITVRGGLFLIAFGGVLGFSLGLIAGTRSLKKDLDELERLHADTRTRVFALDTIDEAEDVLGIGRERAPRPLELCKECGGTEGASSHREGSSSYHAFVGPADQLFPHAADSDELPGTDIP